jgi:flagellar biosynthetic protein FliP
MMLASTAYAEPISIDLDNIGISSKVMQIMAVVTVLSLAPSILVMVTSFTRIAIVFSFLRSAIGLQQTPPNSVLVSLALFLTMFIMSPTLERSYKEGFEPLIEEKINEQQAFPKIVKPFSEFMTKHAKKRDVELFLDMANVNIKDGSEVPLRCLIPAFMISELSRAFEIGFLIFLPFLIIDLLVSSVLMAMGMMMLPPAMIALPFKLVFFVMIDGWYIISGSLVQSFVKHV